MSYFSPFMKSFNPNPFSSPSGGATGMTQPNMAGPQIPKLPNGPARGSGGMTTMQPSQQQQQGGMFSSMLNNPLSMMGAGSLGKNAISGGGQAPGFLEKLFNPDFAAALQDTGGMPGPGTLHGVPPSGAMPAGDPMTFGGEFTSPFAPSGAMDTLGSGNLSPEMLMGSGNVPLGGAGIDGSALMAPELMGGGGAMDLFGAGGLGLESLMGGAGAGIGAGELAGGAAIAAEDLWPLLLMA